MEQQRYIPGLFKAVAAAMAAGVEKVTGPTGIDPITRMDQTWSGLMPKRMDRINTTSHKHHMNGAKECARRQRQMRLSTHGL